LRPGDRVLLDDGRIELAVRAVSDGQAEASVVRGGLLGERKGVSVPGRTLPLPALTEKDLSDLKLAVELEVDYLALSFVRRPEDVNAIWDGTDAVMLSQETSIGAHPVEAVRAMARICLAAQKHPDYERARQIWREPGEVGSAIAHAAAATAAEIHAKLIIAFTESGTTALRCST